MKRKLIWMVAAAALTLAAAAGAGNVSCPRHLGSTCWPNGKIIPETLAKGYSCSCGDEVWVAK